MGNVFHISQQSISKKIKSNKKLALQLSSKINISSVNEILAGKKHEEVANIYDLSRSRITQIWGDWLSNINELYNSGTPKEEIIEWIDKKIITEFVLES